MIKRALSTLLIFLAAPLVLAQLDIGMEFVEIGDPGNPADPFTDGSIGSVSYAFRMAKYEVTNAQYVTFLNSVDQLGNNSRQLYVGGMSGPQGGITLDLSRASGQKYEAKPSRGNHPVTYLSYFSALRFANWLHVGDTESGAYTLTSVEPSTSPQRNPDARFWVPNRDEWHKAAYYQGSNSPLRPIYGTGYSLYPMGGFVANADDPTGAINSANFSNAVGDFFPVGSYSGSFSHYGTADQGGNAEEWYDRGENTRPGWLGGSFRDGSKSLQAGAGSGTTTGGDRERGFRLATASESQPAPITPVIEARAAIELSWQTQIGVRYQIQGSSDGESWVDIGNQLSGNGDTMSSLQTIRDTRKFYRVIVSP